MNVVDRGFDDHVDCGSFLPPVLVDTAKQQRPSDPVVVDRLPQRRVLGVVHPHQTDLDQPPAASDLSVQDALCIFDVDAQRLLAQHRFAGFDAGDCQVGMGRIRRRNYDRFDNMVADERWRVGENRRPATGCGNLIGAHLVQIHDGDDLGCANSLRKIVRVAATHASGADDSDPLASIAHWPTFQNRRCVARWQNLTPATNHVQQTRKRRCQGSGAASAQDEEAQNLDGHQSH